MNKSLAGAGTLSPIPGTVAGTGVDAHKASSAGRSANRPDVPPRCSSQAQPVWHDGLTKGIFNPRKIDFHLGLAQKWAKSAVRETRKQGQKKKKKKAKAKRGSCEILISSLGGGGSCGWEQGRAGPLSSCGG